MENSLAHDKVEFEILFTCFTPLKKTGEYEILSFSTKESIKISESLKNVNKHALEQLENILRKHHKLKVKQKNIIKFWKMYEIDKINWLIEE